ncbi:hypothetical protein [Flavobacterium restrictum]|uniref:VCBS repeat-containing protein n=1 Tax=Flavobacterium restrictum TaxID=2594428 RepID=A0A553DQW2_9FLAO|nr:hypothetical protein [Flavobacterium restrictum]TRX35060.1 hypothetical protein FNW21_15625 [Flavobacterium restrictum]
MKYILILFSSIILFSGEHLKKKVIVRNVREKDTLIYSVSAKILGTTYHADYRSNSILYVINSKNDTITKQEEIGIAPNSLKFEDFNKDGTLDIRYGYNSNYYYEMILLFDSKTKKFRKIEDIDIPEYAYSKKNKNTDLYYSYSPNGCGKNNWTSYLFSINDYKIIPKGLIEYRQCVDDKKGMYVFKINNEKKILIDKITLKEADKKQLEKQWNEHLKKIASP